MFAKRRPWISLVKDTELRDWQARLALHFATLRDRRHSNASERPVFGLEHGLRPSEVQAVEAALRTHIADRPPSRDHALAWIVYSSELGYRYSGEEYWQTFERETPGWTDNGDRYWIRKCYRKFQREFGGAVPSGTWADHFSIICWPITHAILPRDLQRQLARTLYELRYAFSEEILESPVLLGELIAARSWNATSRFQNLTQETQFLGQFAKALLFQGEFGTGNLMHPSTLKRIGEDLDRERVAREWLRGARRSAKERVQVRGLSLLGRGQNPSNISRLDEARAEVSKLGIEPRLLLRPTDSPSVSWEVSLEIPELSHLLLRFPRTRAILTGSRCVVAGASGRPLARGRCLHGAQRVTLARWPRADEVLLQFAQTDPQLDYLLRVECLLRPDPTWLFRIASDGLAYECRRLRVRPGERYILVSSAGPVRSDGHVRPIDFSCEGVHGAILELPQALTADWEDSLRTLGLEQAKTVEVWPAGLAAVVWDGEGYGEWLASERPCLAILTDHPLASLLISMGSNANLSLELTSVNPSEPIFVELPELPVGFHSVHVSARSLAGQTEQPGDLDVVMRIREPRPWSPGVSLQGPLWVQTEPEVPTLEQLWEGRVEVSLRGPKGRKVECHVSLFERDGDTATVAKQLPPIGLPFTINDWRAYFDKHFRKTKKAREAYDTSRACKLEFKADELGAFTVHCERDFTPLRWALRRRAPGYILQLLDDSGDSEQPVVSRMAFEMPCDDEILALAAEYQVPASGGMYVAQKGTFSAAIVVPPIMVCSFADLGCVPHIERRERSIASVIRAVEIAGLWSRARLPGDPFSVTRQRFVMRALVNDVFRLLCGENWARAEKEEEINSPTGTSTLESLSGAVSRHSREASVGGILFRESETLADATCKARIHLLASLAAEYRLLPSCPVPNGLSGGIDGPENSSVGVDAAEWLAEFSLRLASDPASVEPWAGQHLLGGLECLLEKPVLARAARFLVIATDRHLQPQPVFGELYASWRWT